ncbi:hypothetical protein M406DRAFT_332043 [Cryphonectria parasitica EP155]|uniref:Uncharacterized protein n=1 Tax=Cryphonectria parasitica (strain ATCC 38755 / EP155) TaxID=660469 RepID=A0A9P4XSG2_CRYP1|nr:uncharacterized protein M406DRAFT_335306 [Cryphonectria parasitica EP155]XP_040774532.1 uncharacterized protein M406DRAFT_332043 [Cryphonectria parasitica EP155]KAF3760111.1 hypothetical protein M406DRAFT_335306 [Cryphonectria parasitica EP155]KAF3763571.1 hypothetical protein M406DRAFT_332043 [Cryphonectria parasitica EP155]
MLLLLLLLLLLVVVVVVMAILVVVVAGRARQLVIVPSRSMQSQLPGSKHLRWPRHAAAVALLLWWQPRRHAAAVAFLLWWQPRRHAAAMAFLLWWQPRRHAASGLFLPEAHGGLLWTEHQGSCLLQTAAVVVVAIVLNRRTCPWWKTWVSPLYWEIAHIGDGMQIIGENLQVPIGDVMDPKRMVEGEDEEDEKNTQQLLRRWFRAELFVQEGESERYNTAYGARDE